MSLKETKTKEIENLKKLKDNQNTNKNDLNFDEFIKLCKNEQNMKKEQISQVFNSYVKKQQNQINEKDEILNKLSK